MRLKKSKFGTVLLLLTMIFTVFGGSATASSASDDLSQLDNYIDVKTYNENDPDYFVDDPNFELVIDPKEVDSIFQKIDSQTTSSLNDNKKSEIEILDKTTHKVKDLKNEITGETATQYVTDITIMSDGFQSEWEYDGSYSVKLTISMYYTNYYDSMYIGMDKVYYRWDKIDSQITSGVADLVEIFQIGPTKTGGNLNQKHERINGSIVFNQTREFIVSDWNWKPILKDGLLTRVGVYIESTITRRNGDSWSMPNFGIIMTGQNPWG